MLVSDYIMKKRNILIFILFILILLTITLIILKVCFDVTSLKYMSYKIDAYSKDGSFTQTYYDYFDTSLKITNSNITICDSYLDECDVVSYELHGNKYVLITDSEKILNANISIYKEGKELRIKKKIKNGDYDYVIFFFKRVRK